MRAWILLCLAAIAAPAAALDVTTLWDFSNPQLSEQRFRSALESATEDDAFILRTQIARTYMLRKQFTTARALLDELEPALKTASPEAQARYWLELGRSYASHQHPPESQTPQTQRLARDAYTRALKVSKRAKLDYLTVDALHMFVFVDTAPADQLRWNLEALAVIESSSDPQAQRWEGSIRSNTGEALYDLGRYDEALKHFRRALELREKGTNGAAIRDARWHIARVLRMQDRIEDALALQLQNEREAEAAKQPRVYIFEELERLYRARQQPDRADHYSRLVEAHAR